MDYSFKNLTMKNIRVKGWFPKADISWRKLLKYGSYAHGCMLKGRAKGGGGVEKIEHNEEKG